MAPLSLSSVGAAVQTFTNELTGTTITENVSGPGTVTNYPDGSGVINTRGRSSEFFIPALAAE
jgi:hypothetical protein